MGLTLVTRSLTQKEQVRGSGRPTSGQSLSKSKSGSPPSSGGVLERYRDSYSSSKPSTKPSSSTKTTPR